MKTIPCYGKILNLGSRYTENALVGDVIIQEKVDGSQFRFGLNEDNEVVIGSKGTILCKEAPEKMFKKGLNYIMSMESDIQKFPIDTYFYAEYLEKPKHNVLSYERIPTNNIVLFDVIIKGKFVEREELKNIATRLNIDYIPELYRGIVDVEKIKSLLTTSSYLGKELIEGVVIKNYTQTILLGGQIFPLFTKYVREAYKERHDIDWKTKSPTNNLQEYINSFKNENRWQKAIIHLKEKELLTTSPKDIGLLIREIQKDILIEEKENIKNYLFKFFEEDILRNSIKGFPEWYKEKLLENVKQGEKNEI